MLINIPNTPNTTVKSKKSIFRKVCEWLHLWLGLISGIIVFVVCLTGGLWVFRHEVWRFTEKYMWVSPQQKAVLLPSVLIAKSGTYLENKGDTTFTFGSITYGGPAKSVACNFDLPGEKYVTLYINPYTAEILKDKRERSAAENFFIFVRAGHRFLWLPPKTGSPVVGIGCIIFLIILITGLIWWYPKKWTRKTREKSFKIKWSAKWKRLNIDLHNVLGFYTFLFVIVLTISGIVYSFDWFERGLYSTLTWKEKKEVTPHPLSDTTTVTGIKIMQPIDVLWKQMEEKYTGRYGRLFIEAPHELKDPYEVVLNLGDGTRVYDMAFHYFDQTTLKELPNPNDKAIPFHTLSIGEQAFRMNFDIHTGQILGLPTKIIAFIACIVGAGLPVTGVIIWYNRKWGKKKTRKYGGGKQV